MLRQFNVRSFNELEIGRDKSGSGPSSPAEMNLGPIGPLEKREPCHLVDTLSSFYKQYL